VREGEKRLVFHLFLYVEFHTPKQVFPISTPFQCLVGKKFLGLGEGGGVSMRMGEKQGAFADDDFLNISGAGWNNGSRNNNRNVRKISETVEAKNLQTDENANHPLR
jgi:hypothetical protein